jgi:phage head maturation protease
MRHFIRRKVMKLYADISKTEEQEDGTIKVYGFASSQSVDSDGEIVTSEAIRTAIPDYMKFGAVREMHDSKKAAGTALEMKVEDDGRTTFAAHITDPVAVTKVKTGTYKGFSIGGRALTKERGNVQKGEATKITELKLVEVSLVDRPANPDAILTCFKADEVEKPPHDSEEQEAIAHLQELVNKGAISPKRLAALAAEQVKKAKHEDMLAKSFWDAADLAQMQALLKRLQANAKFGKAMAGESDTVPTRLAKSVAGLSAILMDMAIEPQDDTITKAAEPAAALQEAPCENMGNPALGDDLAKALRSEIADVKKQLQEALAQPAPAKAILKTIGKAEDIGDIGSGIAKAEHPPADATQEQIAAWEIKKLHASHGLL